EIPRGKNSGAGSAGGNGSARGAAGVTERQYGARSRCGIRRLRSAKSPSAACLPPPVLWLVSRKAGRIGAPPRAAGDVVSPRVCGSRRSSQLWSAFWGRISPGRRLCRQDIERRKDNRPSGDTADQI